MSNYLLETLGITEVENANGKCIVEMPITDKVLQPLGFVHGGINVVLAETAASLGTFKMIAEDEIAFGMEVNANHLKAKREGVLTATAVLKHGGSTVHVWEIEVTDEDDALVALSRCTVAIRKKR